MQAVGELHLTRDRIMVLDQGTGVVEQQLARQSAKMAERTLDPLQPRGLPLMPECRRVDTPRVAERGHEQEHLAQVLALDRDPALAKIDL